MITKQDQLYILKLVKENIDLCLNEVGFDPTVKEPGHSFGEMVEENLVDKLASIDANFSKPSKVKGKGKQTRKMEDFVWKGNTLVNVKLGYEKGKGQPNMVAFNRLLTKFDSGEIDSYYIFVINVKGSSKDNLSTDLCLFNIFDYLDCINYNYGTGQVMLKESNFFSQYDLEKEFNNTKSDIMQKLAVIDNLAFTSHIKKKEMQHKQRQTNIFMKYQ
jgi:hypothetical protein